MLKKIMTHKSIAYVALGSNLENKEHHILTAIEEIDALDEVCVTKRSSLYQTKAVGPEPQDDFINAVIKIETSLSPHQLLETLLQIEQQHGRKRTIKWGPRTLDLDILLFDDLKIETETLIVPHPRMFEREFVLVPLFEIAPELKDLLSPQ